MKTCILLLLWLYYLFTIMSVKAQSADNADADDGASNSADDDDGVTITGNNGYYNGEAAGYYPYQQYGGGGWKKSSWSSDWKKSSSSSSSWGKGRKGKGKGKGGKYGGPPQHPPKCPFGLAQIWFGSLSKLPYGYQICDGTNGTPDLRDRLVMGAGTQFPFGTTGGSANVVLSEAQLAPHVHAAGSLMANPDGQHAHQVTATLDGGAHQHTALHLVVGDAGNHVHDIDLVSGNGGDHDHTFDAFKPVDYDTNPAHQKFAVPIDAVDKHESYAQQVSQHDGHTHAVQGDTAAAGEHTHPITGSIGPDGDHTHNLNAPTSEAGIHSHPVVGNTGETGNGAPINILNPYHALYFICCGKEEYHPPSWQNSQYY